jgi:hypothetical protein
VNIKPPKRTAPAVLLALLTLTTACGGNASVDPPATSAAVPNTPPPTVLPPTTSAPPNTAPTTTTPPPSPSATTDEAATRQAVIAATQEAWVAFNDAVVNPTSDEAFQSLGQHFAGEVLIRSRQIVETYRAESKRELPSDVVATRVDVRTDSVQVDSSSGTAVLEVCRVGSNVLVETGGNPDGSDRVLDDTINAHLERNQLVLENGTWYVTEDTALESFAGAVECAR